MTDTRVIHGVSIKEYQAVHHWLRKNYGKASKCEAIDCNKQSSNFSWALVRGLEYDYKRENFIELCRACHAIYDTTEQTREKMSNSSPRKNKTHCLKSHPLSGRNLMITVSPSGKVNRQCRVCARARNKAWKHTQKGRRFVAKYNKAYSIKVVAKAVAEERERIIKLVPGSLDEQSGYDKYAIGYNQAVSDFLTTLKNINE